MKPRMISDLFTIQDGSGIGTRTYEIGGEPALPVPPAPKGGSAIKVPPQDPKIGATMNSQSRT